MKKELIVTTPDNAQIWDDEKQLEDLRKVFGAKLSETEWKTFLGIGKATGLNPFTKELWAIKYKEGQPASIFIARDGYRKAAQRNPLYDYHQVDAVYSGDEFKIVNGEIHHSYQLKDRGSLVGAYCIVQRKGATKPTYTYVERKEYDTGYSNWQKMPATMLKKVAEAQALRMAFQEMFSGTYTEEEQWEQEQPNSNIKPLRGSLVKKEEQTPPKEIKTQPDTIKGEIVEDKKEEENKQDHPKDIIKDVATPVTPKPDLATARKLFFAIATKYQKKFNKTDADIKQWLIDQAYIVKSRTEMTEKDFTKAAETLQREIDGTTEVQETPKPELSEDFQKIDMVGAVIDAYKEKFPDHDEGQMNKTLNAAANKYFQEERFGDLSLQEMDKILQQLRNVKTHG
jgi:phage recombination protein Bet